jgi:hypothetical protein
VHDHETCDRLMTEAMRKGIEGKGRLEYLAMRCDRAHGHLTNPHAQVARADLTAQPADERPTDE